MAVASKGDTAEMEEHLKSMIERLSCQPIRDSAHKDLDENQKRWLVVGVCLHSIISPQLRKFIEPEVQQLYNKTVAAHQLYTQMFPNILEKYPPPNGYRLNYQSINNNTIHGRNVRNFDYAVKNHIDFSKLFLLPHMAHYAGFNESCDSSALLGLIVNIQIFQPALRTVIEKIRTEVRNDWAHCDFRQWDENKFARAFVLFQQTIRELRLQAQEEQDIIDSLTKWETKGQHMLDGGKLLSGVFSEIQQELSVLARYMLNLETSVMNTVPRNIREQYLRIIENWTKQDEHFIETEAFRHTYGVCQQSNIITITGNAGSGKSAIAYHIALRLSTEGYSILPVTSLDEVQRFWDSQKKQVFVFDDPVGTETLDVLKMADVQAKNNYIYSLLTETSSKIIFTCRAIVIRERAVKDTTSMLTQNIIDLHSDALSLSKAEKIQILEHYTRSVESTSVDIDRVSDLNCYNFPFLCSMYAKNEQYQSKGNSFFDKMFPVLQEELDHLRNMSPLKYLVIVLYLVLANENRAINISKCENAVDQSIDLAKALGIPSNFSKEDLKAAEDSLFNVYLIREGDIVRFLHDTLFEAVVYHFGKCCPREILKRCTPSFIREHITIGPEELNKYSVHLKRNDYGELASRYVTNIRNGQFHDTFLSEPMKDDTILECIREEIDKMSQDECSQIFLETSSLENKTVGIKQSSWDRNASVYKVLEEDNTKPVHWILAFHHFRLFSFLYPNICNAYKSKKRLLNFTKKKQKHSQKHYLIPMTCLSGNTELLDMLLNSGRFGSLKDVWGSRKLSTLHMAILSGQLEMVNLVLYSGVDINVEDELEITPLFQAAAAGLREICELLIENGANINKGSKTGETPLFIASQEGHIDVVKLLLDNACKVEECRNDGSSPLIIAIFNKHIDIAKLLIENGADVDTKCVDGTSSLYVAAKIGSLEVVQFLTDHKASLTMNTHGQSPLIAAARNGFVDIGEHLMKLNVDVNECSPERKSPINIAVENGNTEMFNLLLQHGASVRLCDKNGVSPLHRASDKGYTDIVETILKLNIDPNIVTNEGFSPVWIATANGHVDTVKCLLQYKADVNICCGEGSSPLLVASQKGNLSLVRSLVQSNAIIDQSTTEGTTPLYVAAMNGNNDVVRFLLESGADINKRVLGETALHVSTWNEHDNVVRTLLEHGADVRLSSDDGSTPLSVAAFVGFANIDELIQKSADVNATDEKGRSPLFIAARQGHLETVKKLIQNKADVNLCSKTSDSPLMVAAYNGFLSVVQELIKNGASINAKGMNGESALQIASYQGHNDVVLYLKHKGADINTTNAIGETPLICASIKGNISTVQCLLNLGADIHKRDDRGWDALSLAALFGHSAIVGILNHKMRPLYNRFK